MGLGDGEFGIGGRDEGDDRIVWADRGPEADSRLLRTGSMDFPRNREGRSLWHGGATPPNLDPAAVALD